VETVKRKLSELVFDFDLYPRTDVDSTHVSAMREADRAGATFPPYVIDAASKRVVDGFHRGRKDRMEHGEDCEVECIEKQYRNEGEMFLDAMRCNSSHGRPLSPYDRARCALKCRKFRVGIAAIAAALGMKPETVKAIGEGRTAKVRTESGGHDVTLKRTIAHMAGRDLSPEQQTANERLSGMQQAFYVNQLLLLIDHNLLDNSDESLMDLLRQLHEKLGTIVASCSVA
jgi:hypothetical protein